MATVSGGLAMRGEVAGGGSAVFAVQAASLKGEDKFIAEPDVRRSTSATARKRAARRPPGDLLACFAVFDGHVNASASSRRASHAPRAPRVRRERARGAPRDVVCLRVRVGRAILQARRDVRRVLLEVRRRPQGGTTACVVLLHLCRGPAGPHLDVVAANAGDSGALLVQKRSDEQRSPNPSDDDAPASFTRLSRDHNPDDPLEAVRLANAGARLGRMRQGGEEVGPVRSYPGGLAVSRAIGDSDPRRRLRPGG